MKDIKNNGTILSKQKLTEQQFKSESEFENIIVENSKLFFGNSSLFIETKKKN